MVNMDIKEDDKYKKRNRQLQRTGSFLILIVVVLATLGFAYFNLYPFLPSKTSTSYEGIPFSDRKEEFLKKNGIPGKRMSAVRRRDAVSLDGNHMDSKFAHIDIAKMKMASNLAASVREAAMLIHNQKGGDLNLKGLHRTPKDSPMDMLAHHDKLKVDLDNQSEHVEEASQDDERATKEHYA